MGHPAWPELDYGAWKDTCQTLHRWSQIVGKIRLSKSPWTNHSWHSTLYVTEAGLTTSVIHDRESSFSIELDLLSHLLRVRTSRGDYTQLPLQPESVSVFHDRCLEALREIGIEARISPCPNELVDATPFASDFVHRAYDAGYADRFRRILLQCDRLMKAFRSRFVGKASPVHFFWGSFDLATARFSGRRAPEHPGGFPHLPDLVTRDAYSHEESSCGFWPGNELFPAAAFYSYAYPAPRGFEAARVPAGAFFEPRLREFVLPLEAVRAAPDPDSLVLGFFEATYAAAADLGGWDRAALEDSPYLRELQRRAA